MRYQNFIFYGSLLQPLDAKGVHGYQLTVVHHRPGAAREQALIFGMRHFLKLWLCCLVE